MLYFLKLPPPTSRVVQSDMRILVLSHNIPDRLYRQWLQRPINMPVTLIMDTSEIESVEKLVPECLILLLKLGNFILQNPKVSSNLQSDIGWVPGTCLMSRRSLSLWNYCWVIQSSLQLAGDQEYGHFTLRTAETLQWGEPCFRRTAVSRDILSFPPPWNDITTFPSLALNGCIGSIGSGWRDELVV